MTVFYRQGDIVAIEGGNAVIQLSLQGFCSGGHGCALNAFAEGVSADKTRVSAENAIGASIGERVIIGVYSPGFFRALFFVFVLPLLGIIVGAFVGIKLAAWTDVPHRQDLYASGSSLVLCTLLLLVSRFVDKRVHPRYVIHGRVDVLGNCAGCSLQKKTLHIYGKN